MRWKNSYEGLDVLVAERGSALLGTAVLLAGSRVAGEDLLQAALERLAKVVYEATMHFATETFVADETLEFSDYGSPVTVERPAVTTEDLPGKPSR